MRRLPRPLTALCLGLSSFLVAGCLDYKPVTTRGSAPQRKQSYEMPPPPRQNDPLDSFPPPTEPAQKDSGTAPKATEPAKKDTAPAATKPAATEKAGTGTAPKPAGTEIKGTSTAPKPTAPGK